MFLKFASMRNIGRRKQELGDEQGVFIHRIFFVVLYQLQLAKSFPELFAVGLAYPAKR